jgi:hypothetical protein
VRLEFEAVPGPKLISLRMEQPNVLSVGSIPALMDTPSNRLSVGNSEPEVEEKGKKQINRSIL